MNKVERQEQDHHLPEDLKENPNQDMPHRAPRKTDGETGKKQKQQQPFFVGRITLGVLLIAVGLLVTVSLLMPNVHLLQAAKFAPLILVVLGAEVLIGAARAKDRQVKVGFGLTFLCLLLIFGSVGAAMLPELWDEYGPGKWEETKAQEMQLKKEIYTQLDAEALESVDVSIDIMHGRLNTSQKTTRVSLAGDFQSAAAFSEAAAPILNTLAELGLDYATICAECPADRWMLSMDGVYSIQNVTAEDLEPRVVHQQYVLDASGNREAVERSQYEAMQESGLLVKADAVEAARRKAWDAGYQQALQDMQNESSSQ